MSDLGGVSRKLVAVFAADVEGYSRLMEADEVGTLKALTERRAILDRLIAEHRGRIANTAGDSVLAEFGSAVDAVECAVKAQAVLAESNTGIEPARRINFRMGLHVGDVMVRAGDLFGEGVNIAARLEGLAEPGGICISSAAYDQVHGKLGFRFDDLGEQSLKNISRPVRAYAVGGVKVNGAELPPRTSSAPALSIVVLPFANLGGDPDQEHFADGVTESLTTDLSRIAGAFVIARNTAFTFKGKAVDVKKIGRELNIRYVLEGSVQRGSGRLRVNVQLIDAHTANHIWAERFDKPLSDLFEMQDEIVSRLANALDGQLVAAEARRVEQSVNPSAMDLVFRGKACIYKGPTTAKYLLEAEELFDRALAMDPSNVEALVGKGRANANLGTAALDSRTRLVTAEETLTRALLYDPHHAVAHANLGLILIMSAELDRVDDGIAACERALVLDQNLAHAHGLIGLGKYRSCRPAETEAHVQEALRLSPRDTQSYLWMNWVGFSKAFLGADEEAVRWLRRGLEANRNYPVGHFHLAASLMRLGQVADARAAVRAGLALDPNFTVVRLRAGHPDNAEFVALRERVYESMMLAGLPEH